MFGLLIMSVGQWMILYNFVPEPYRRAVLFGLLTLNSGFVAVLSR